MTEGTLPSRGLNLRVVAKYSDFGLPPIATISETYFALNIDELAISRKRCKTAGKLV